MEGVNAMQESQPSASQIQQWTRPSFEPRDRGLGDNLSTGCLGYSSRISNTPQADLGALDRLPLEILQETISQLDIQAFTNFRQVNRRAIEITDSNSLHRTITKYARTALRGILATGIGKWILLKTLYKTLCMNTCKECGNFGIYLYLLTCERVCNPCFADSYRFLPLRHAHANWKYGLTPQILQTLPRMKSIPGVYSQWNNSFPDRIYLVDSNTAYRAGLARHGSVKAMEQYVQTIKARAIAAHDKKLPISTRQHSSPMPQSDDSEDGTWGNPLRYMAIVRIPWLNKPSPHQVSAEWGLQCKGCIRWYPIRHTVASFREHIRERGIIAIDRQDDNGNDVWEHPNKAKVTTT